MKRDMSAAEWHLNNWAAWMHGGKVGRGYPSRSAGIACGGASTEDTFYEMCEEADISQAKTADSVISDLPPHYQAAIAHVHLASVYRMRQPIEVVYAEAVEMFWKKAQARGLV